jgi:hypothetical protein
MRRNQAAFERTVRALRATGRLEDVDAALVAAGRTLAALMDDRDEPTVQCAYAYLSVLRQLRGGTVGSDDAIGDLLASMRTPLGDAPES